VKIGLAQPEIKIGKNVRRKTVVSSLQSFKKGKNRQTSRNERAVQNRCTDRQTETIEVQKRQTGRQERLMVQADETDNKAVQTYKQVDRKYMEQTDGTYRQNTYRQTDWQNRLISWRQMGQTDSMAKDSTRA